MGRKPVLGLAGLFLASVTLTGCENTDWCCWGKKTPEPAQVRTQTPPQKGPPKMWEDEPAGGRAPQVDPSIIPPAEPSVNVPNKPAPRTEFRSPEESEMPPSPPKPVSGPDLNDPLLPPLDPQAKNPVTAPETNRGAKNPPTVNPAPALEDPLPILEPPPPPTRVPDGSTNSSSKYQSTPPSPDDPPPPVGVPVIKGGGLKGN